MQLHQEEINCIVLYCIVLRWDNFDIRRKKHKALLMFKSLNEQAAVYLQNLFHKRSTDYDLHNFFRQLALPRLRTNYLKQSFSYSSALLWNKNVREIKSVRKFKEQSIIYLSHQTLTQQSCKTVCRLFVVQLIGIRCLLYY